MSVCVYLKTISDILLVISQNIKRSHDHDHTYLLNEELLSIIIYLVTIFLGTVVVWHLMLGRMFNAI